MSSGTTPSGASGAARRTVPAQHRFRTAWSRVRRGLGSARQIVRGVVGENAYERYLEHQRTHHPDATPLGEREFWRRHVDRGDTHPGSRCC